MRERQNGSCPMNRCVHEDVKDMSSRLRWAVSSLPRAMGMSGPGLLLGPGLGSGSDVFTVSVNICTSHCQERQRGYGCTELVPLLTGCNTGENWSYLSLAEALRKEGPTSHLGSTIELILFTGAWESHVVSWVMERFPPTLAP